MSPLLSDMIAQAELGCEAGPIFQSFRRLAMIGNTGLLLPGPNRALRAGHRFSGHVRGTIYKLFLVLQLFEVDDVGAGDVYQLASADLTGLVRQAGALEEAEGELCEHGG